MATDTDSATKASLALESAHTVAIYRRARRVVIEFDGGVSATWRGISTVDMNNSARICMAAGYKLMPGYGCGERWVRQ